MNNQKIENSEFTGLETKKAKKSPPKLRMIILGLLIVFGIFTIYKFAANVYSGPSAKDNSTQARSTEIISKKERPRINSLAPDFISEDVFGNRVTLSDFRGQKPVLLIFWATWCIYCAKELPDLKTFTEEHRDEIKIITVASGETKETIKSYIREKDVNFLMLLDEQREVWNTYLVRGTPSHFLIDWEGKIIAIMPGLALMSDLEIILSML